MTRQPRAGILPLYLALYDHIAPEAIDELETILPLISDKLNAQGIDTSVASTCRTAQQFSTQITALEDQDVDLLITIHLAYSPSLESLESLVSTTLPILVLDTTLDHDFGLTASSDRIMFNHGIHGVQDMCSMLRRHNRHFEIVAGHITCSDVIERAANASRAAYAARLFHSTKVLRVGQPFPGMGDFSVTNDVMKGVLGITASEVGLDAIVPFVEAITADQIEKEMASDTAIFDIDLPDECHLRSTRIGLGLRAYLQQNNFDAFSVNFLAFDSCDGPVNTVPFMEISKAMSRGIGYAGEGDVLTASMVGALIKAFNLATFTEIFCPDWKGDSIFLSHMGEINPAIAASKPRLCERDYTLSDALNPAMITCTPQAGPAVFINLSPGPDDSFRLIITPVEMLADSTNPDMQNVVRGWMRAPGGTAAFLEQYSRLGGTHHSALVLGDQLEAISIFARYAGLECSIIN